MEVHSEAILSALEVRCPAGWQANVDDTFEVVVNDAVYLDATDAFLAGNEQPLRDYYATIIPDRTEARHEVAAEIVAAVGLNPGHEPGLVARVAAMVADRDQIDPLDEAGGGLTPELLRIEVGSIDAGESFGQVPWMPWFYLVEARERLLRDTLQEALLWHPRMESHLRSLAASEGWGEGMRFDLRFAGSPSRVRVPADGELWDWLLVLTRDDGTQICSDFDQHDHHPAERLRLLFHAGRPARMDREALAEGQLETWEYPSGLFDDRLHLVFDDEEEDTEDDVAAVHELRPHADAGDGGE